MLKAKIRVRAMNNRFVFKTDSIFKHIAFISGFFIFIIGITLTLLKALSYMEIVIVLITSFASVFIGLLLQKKIIIDESGVTGNDFKVLWKDIVMICYSIRNYSFGVPLSSSAGIDVKIKIITERNYYCINSTIRDYDKILNALKFFYKGKIENISGS